MGGVPFKSTGCNTCRRRKVKCDETKPKCRRCTKNGHVCTGYERDRVFIHKSSISMVEGSQKLVHRPCTPSQTASARQRGRVEPGIPRLNASVEVRSQLLQSFLDWYMPPSEYLQDATGRGLLETLPHLAGSSRLLDKAIASLSTAFLAQQNGDRHLLQYSTKLYGDAIQTLNGKIRTGEDIGKDVLYTTVIFQFYELINCSPPGFSAWIAHVQGSNAVVQQYVGREDQPAVERLFHRQLKLTTICDAIGKRKAACLSRTLAWDHGSSQGKAKRDHVDEIMNKLVEQF